MFSHNEKETTDKSSKFTKTCEVCWEEKLTLWWKNHVGEHDQIENSTAIDILTIDICEGLSSNHIVKHVF